MEDNKAKSIINISNELHDKVDDIYEGLMEEDEESTINSIESLRVDLKDLKDSISNKSKIEL